MATDNKLDKIMLAVLELASVAVGARLAIDGTPETEPAELPVVYVEWSNTEPQSDAYGSRSGRALVANAKHRQHNGSIIILNDAGTDAALATSAARPIAQKLMDAFEGDTTLEDVEGVKVADKCVLSLVEPAAYQWGETIYWGVKAEFQAVEML